MQNNSEKILSSPINTHCCVQRNALFNCLDAPQRDALSSIIYHSRIVHKGDLLFRQGDPFYRVYLIGSGSFKSSISDESGNLHITAFNFSSNILGFDGLCSGVHIYDVEALETASVCSIAFDLLEEILGQDLGRFYRQLISKVYKDDFCNNRSSMIFCRMRSEQRLARFFLGLSKSMGNRGCSILDFPLTMTRSDLASYLGITPETLSRVFRRFQDERLIGVVGHRVLILNIEGLRAVEAGEHDFFELRSQMSMLKKTA